MTISVLIAYFWVILYLWQKENFLFFSFFDYYKGVLSFRFFFLRCGCAHTRVIWVAGYKWHFPENVHLLKQLYPSVKHVWAKDNLYHWRVKVLYSIFTLYQLPFLILPPTQPTGHPMLYSKAISYILIYKWLRSVCLEHNRQEKNHKCLFVFYFLLFFVVFFFKSWE